MKHFMIIFAYILASLAPTQGAQIRLEPDDYSDNAVLPNNLGVKLRNSSYPPGHMNFDDPWRPLRAKSPDSYPTIPPSTGSLLIGNDYSAYFDGINYGMRAWFVSADNTVKETSYVGFDLCWPTTLTFSEGVLVQAWANDSSGANSRIFSKVYAPESQHSRFSLYHEGITKVTAVCYDNPNSFRSHYFAVDNLRFTDTSSSSRFTVDPSSVLAAPEGMVINPLDTLDGTGTVDGNVVNNGFVGPGNSPGTLRIDGDYTQSESGELTIELAGVNEGEFDVLSVMGAASLDGALRIELADGFVPTEEDGPFTIMEFASVSGQFDSVIMPDGIEMELDYSTPGEMRLSVIPEPGTLGLLVIGVGTLVVYRRNYSDHALLKRARRR